MKVKKWLITNRLLKKLKNSLFRPINNTNIISGRHLSSGRQAGLKRSPANQPCTIYEGTFMRPLLEKN